MTFISSIERQGDNLNLYKYGGEDLKPSDDQPRSEEGQNDTVAVICFLDLETTGTDKLEDKIIEIAMRTIVINKETGRLVSVAAEYESLQDPGIPITEEATLINGITNEMVMDKAINWETVEDMIENADLIVAHNARFDRGFLDQCLPVSQDKIWACSMMDIDWFRKGFTSSKQELLCIWHGFYYDSHRGMNDVNALIHLVTHPHYPESEKPLFELQANAARPYCKIIARNFAYDPILKDRVKANGYRWDGNFWWIRIEYSRSDVLATEKQWLTETIYGDHFLGVIEEIPLTEKYKE